MHLKRYNHSFLNFLFLIILLFGSTSCAVLEGLNNIQEPRLRVVDARLTKLSLKDAELTFDVEVDNPNTFSASLQNYRYDLSLNDRSFINGDRAASTTIDAAAASIIQIPVNLSYTDLFETFRELRDQDESSYEFSFVAGVQVPALGMVEVPVSHSGTFPIVKLPQIRVEGLRLANLSLTTARFELQLDVQNPNGFDLALSGLDYQIDLNGTSPISGLMNEELNIRSKESTSLTIPLEINVLELGAAARRVIVNGEQIEYSFSGSSQIGSSLPIFERSTFNFDKEGVVDILR